MAEMDRDDGMAEFRDKGDNDEFELRMGDDADEQEQEDEDKQMLQEIEDQIVEIEPSFAAILYESD